jgi:hypothetical protein
MTQILPTDLYEPFGFASAPAVTVMSIQDEFHSVALHALRQTGRRFMMRWRREERTQRRLGKFRLNKAGFRGRATRDSSKNYSLTLVGPRNDA